MCATTLDFHEVSVAIYGIFEVKMGSVFNAYVIACVDAFFLDVPCVHDQVAG